jgi:hypothetical protein
MPYNGGFIAVITNIAAKCCLWRLDDHPRMARMAHKTLTCRQVQHTYLTFFLIIFLFVKSSSNPKYISILKKKLHKQRMKTLVSRSIIYVFFESKTIILLYIYKDQRALHYKFILFYFIFVFKNRVMGQCRGQIRGETSKHIKFLARSLRFHIRFCNW